MKRAPSGLYAAARIDLILKMFLTVNSLAVIHLAQPHVSALFVVHTVLVSK